MSEFTCQGVDYTINDPNNANEFSTSQTYKKGEYVNYSGKLYRFITDHEAGAWNSLHVAETRITKDLSRIMSAMNICAPLTIESDMIFQGYIAGDGNIASSDTRIGAKIIKCQKGDQIIFIPGETINSLKVTYWDDSISIISETVWRNGRSIIAAEQNGYVSFIMRNSSDSEISPSDYDATLKMLSYNTYHKPSMITMEKGGLYNNGKPSYELDTHKKKIRSAYTIYIDGAYMYSIPGNGFNTSTEHAYAYYYNSEFQYVDKQAVTFENNYLIPANVSYMKVMVESLTDGTDLSVKPKKIKINFFSEGIDPFEVKNGHYHTDVEWLTFDVTEDVCSCARMLLPSNYNPIGKAVPLILYLSGSGNFTYWTANFPANQLEKNLPYLQDEGFAVLSIFGWGDYFYTKYQYCGRAYPYPTPTCRSVIKAGVEWICDRFNIDINNVHILGKSQGGQNGLFYVSNPDFPLKSISLFAPVLDYFSMPGEDEYVDTRKAIAEDIGMTGTDLSYFTGTGYVGYSERAKALWENNIPQAAGLNEAWTELADEIIQNKLDKSFSDAEEFWTGEAWETPDRTDIYNHTEYKKIGRVPVKIWGASDDDQTPYFKMTEVVEQLKNGGCEAHMRTFPRGEGGHNCADFGSETVNVTTALGVAYEGLSKGMYEAVLWMRSKSVKS